MSDKHNGRSDNAAEDRNKTDLLDQLALKNNNSDQKVAHLLSELQVRQAELEMQNRELREAQQIVEETRDRYAALYDFAPVGYLTLDDTGRIHEVNLTGAAMLGVARSNLVGKLFSTCLANGDSYAFFHHLRQTFLAQGNTVTELRIVNPAGGISYIRLESAPVQDEMRICRTVMTNVTEQRRIALELQQTRSEQEVLLNAIPALVFYKDLNLRYVAISHMLADFFGRPLEDVLGKTDFELFPKDLAEDFQRFCREVLEQGRTRAGVEERLTDANGNTIIVSFVLAPFFNPPGKVAGVLGVGIDISPVKKAANLNQELIQQNRTLMQNIFSIQESERRHLARELHDELGQWLTAIHAEAQAIGSMTEKENKIAASAGAIRESASEMHEVIRNMLHKLRPALLDELGLADSLRELVSQWNKHHTGIGCELELKGELSGWGESTNITIYRIIQEALSNIAKHAQAERVSVHLRREAADRLLLQVVDNGKGLDAEQISNGYGLLGMRERAIAAGGKFSLSSTPGQGVRIDVLLPLNYQADRRNNEHK